jgi:hypothetical protein
MFKNLFSRKKETPDYELANLSNSPQSNNGFAPQRFDFFDPKTTIIQKALPWVIAITVCTFAVLCLIVLIVFTTGLNQNATPTPTVAYTTTFSSLAAVG